MPAVLTPEVAKSVTREMLIEKALVRIVEHQRGLKDTELALLTLAEVCAQPLVSLDLVLQTMHSMISQGRLTAVEYQWRDTSGIFVLPGGSAVVFAVPIPVKRPEATH